MLAGMLTMNMSTAHACSIEATPGPGYTPPPTLSMSELADRHAYLVDAMTRRADLVFEGVVLDVRSENGQDIIVVEVKQYLKGKGLELVHLTQVYDDCLSETVYAGMQGVFFAKGVQRNDIPFLYITRFEPDEATLNQVTASVGTEPFTPERSPSLALMSGLFMLAGLSFAIFAGTTLRRRRQW